MDVRDGNDAGRCPLPKIYWFFCSQLSHSSCEIEYPRYFIQWDPWPCISSQPPPPPPPPPPPHGHLSLSTPPSSSSISAAVEYPRYSYTFAIASVQYVFVDNLPYVELPVFAFSERESLPDSSSIEGGRPYPIPETTLDVTSRAHFLSQTLNFHLGLAYPLIGSLLACICLDGVTGTAVDRTSTLLFSAPVICFLIDRRLKRRCIEMVCSNDLNVVPNKQNKQSVWECTPRYALPAAMHALWLHTTGN